ncbi:hypothetical protein MMC16_005440 [Acarospora aff. strigata]|nr:hypothetical protein [Acarospora aff. strigata]
MAMAVINVIGALTGVVGIGMMVPSVLPEKDEKQTVVRVAAGMTTNEKDDTAGNQPGIGLYDIMGRKIGKTTGQRTKIKDGDFMEIKVPFSIGVGKKPTEYISISNGGNDGLCVAYIALTQPDGTRKAWFGDVGKACGADWYHSQLKTGEDDYQPACIWIDRDHSYGLRYQGFGFHINDFAATDERAKQYDQNRSLMCNAAPRFKMYEKMNSDDYIPFFSPPLEYEPKKLTDKDPKAVLDKKRWGMPKEGPNIKKADIDKNDKPKMARREDPDKMNGRKNFTTVIISKSENHSAKELCQSSMSRGPDFVSLEEQLFCDMDAKRTWPLCSTSKTDGCFDQTTSTMKAGKGLRGRDIDTGLYVPQKSYKKTEHWN